MANDSGGTMIGWVFTLLIMLALAALWIAWQVAKLTYKGLVGAWRYFRTAA